MKKIILESLGKFSIVDTEVPQITSDNDVLIKIAYVGICGSDIHYFKTGQIGDQVIQYPFTPGHECSGIIEKTGKNVTGLTRGDRVAVEPAISCRSCDQCVAGRFHTCRNLQFLGNPLELEGALQEYIVLPQECCFKLPATVSLADGIIIEPLTIGLHALRFMEYHKHIAVLGHGPIGICTVSAIKYLFADSQIYVTDKIDPRLKFAIDRGVSWTGNPLKQNVVAGILEMCPGGVDTVIECCGQQEAIDQAIELLKPGGRLIMIGIPETESISFDPHSIRRKEIHICNVRRQNNKFIEAIDMLEKRAFDVNGFITHTYNIEQIQTAYKLVESYNDGIIKALVTFD